MAPKRPKRAATTRYRNTRAGVNDSTEPAAPPQQSATQPGHKKSVPAQTTGESEPDTDLLVFRVALPISSMNLSSNPPENPASMFSTFQIDTSISTQPTAREPPAQAQAITPTSHRLSTERCQRPKKVIFQRARTDSSESVEDFREALSQVPEESETLSPSLPRGHHRRVTFANASPPSHAGGSIHSTPVTPMPVTLMPVHYESRFPLTSVTHPTPQNVTPSRTTPRNATPNATPVRHITPRCVTSARRRTSHGSTHPKRRVGSGREGATDVWGFFEPKNGKQICNFCSRDVSAGKPVKHYIYEDGSSSSTLRNHLINRHDEEWIQACDQRGITISAQGAEEVVCNYRKHHGGMASQFRKKSQSRKPFTQEGFEDAIINFIVADDQSLNVIECPELRSIFLMLREELQDSDIPHRATIRRRIMQLWEEQLNRVADEMAGALGKISFTTDIWTANNLTPYMAVTAHWIQAIKVEHASGPPTEELVLRVDLIGFCHLPGHHTGKHIAQLFVFITDRIRVTSQIGWVTVDNASNNDTFMSHLEILLRARSIPFDRVQRQIRCFPHIINLACQAIVKSITKIQYMSDKGSSEFVPMESTARTFHEAVTHDPVAHIRALVRVCRASSLRREYFRTCVLEDQKTDYQLLRDVETRWSSTLLMIERAILLRKAIDRFVDNDDFIELAKFKLTEADWDALSRFQNILEKPHAFQQKLSAEATPTLHNALPSFERLVSVWKKHQNRHPETSDIVAAGLEKIEGYSARASVVDAYMLSMFVNSKIKLNWYQKHTPADIPQIKAKILTHLSSYAAISPPSSIPPSHTQPTLARSWADDALNSDSEDESDWHSDHNFSPFSSSLDEELRRYLNDLQVDQDSIRYWQQNRRRFPTIFRLAMDVLPVQGSSVPCERAFSSSAETDAGRRNKISPELMEALQILKFALKKRRLIFTEGMAKEAELKVLEEADSRPEDADSFARELHSLLNRV